MENPAEVTEAVVQEAHPPEKIGFISPDGTMLVLTWVCFFLLLAILKKFAWKPILAGLDAREKMIRDSVEQAEKLRVELEKLDATRKEILNKADTESKRIIQEARKAAGDAAKIIETKAKDEAKIIVENAQREIRDEVNRAQAQLRQESAQIAVQLSEKILAANLDEHKNEKLIDQFLSELKKH